MSGINHVLKYRVAIRRRSIIAIWSSSIMQPVWSYRNFFRVFLVVVGSYINRHLQRLEHTPVKKLKPTSIRKIMSMTRSNMSKGFGRFSASTLSSFQSSKKYARRQGIVITEQSTSMEIRMSQRSLFRLQESGHSQKLEFAMMRESQDGRKLFVSAKTCRGVRCKSWLQIVLHFLSHLCLLPFRRISWQCSVGVSKGVSYPVDLSEYT